MTDKDDNMTNEEADLLDEKADEISAVLEGTPFHIALHALLRITAEIGVQSKDRVTKREFVADTVDCLDFWYETWLEEEQDD